MVTDIVGLAVVGQQGQQGQVELEEAFRRPEQDAVVPEQVAARILRQAAVRLELT
jgi:hypothetical protein